MNYFDNQSRSDASNTEDWVCSTEMSTNVPSKHLTLKHYVSYYNLNVHPQQYILL